MYIIYGIHTHASTNKIKKEPKSMMKYDLKYSFIMSLMI